MNNTFEIQARRVPARIRWALLGICLVAISAILAVAFWMSRTTNTIAAENARRLIESAIAAEMDRVVLTVRDYAYWDEAHEWLTARDDASIYANLGTGATDSETFDLIYMLDARGAPIYAFESDGDGSDVALVDLDVAVAMTTAVGALPLEPYATQTSITRLGDQIALLAAGRIQPDDVTGLTPDDMGIMVGGIFLTEEVLAEYEGQLLLDNLQLQPADAPLIEDRGHIELMDHGAAAVARLSWARPAPGEDMLWQALPLISSLSLLMLGLCFVIGRASAKQTSALLREWTVARTDHLTGLLNRTGLEELVSSPQVRPALAEGKCALLYLDLNEFKALNDNAGHDAGDQALQITAERLMGTVRHTDFIARLGGDEFICLIFDENPGPAAEAIGRRIVFRTEQPLVFEGKKYHARASVGIAVAAPGISWQGLVTRADIAMYHAKAEDRPRPVTYVDGMVRLGERANKRNTAA